MRNRSESIDTIIKGLIKARPQLLDMEADKKGQRGNYIGRDELLRSVNTILGEYGMQIVTRQYIHEKYGMIMSVELHHESGQWFSSDYTIENGQDFTTGDVNWKKGGAITYGIRYTIGAMLGITIGDDDYKPQDHAPQSKYEPVSSPSYNKPVAQLGGPNLKPLWGVLYKIDDKDRRMREINVLKKKYNVKDLALLTQDQVDEIVASYTTQANQMDLEEVF